MLLNYDDKKEPGNVKSNQKTIVIAFITLFPHNKCFNTYSRYLSFSFRIFNGNRTEWSPIRSVIIRVINKIGRPRNVVKGKFFLRFKLVLLVLRGGR